MIQSYPWYISDWRQDEDVIAMSAEQQGIYRNLLDMCWDMGDLPTDDKALRKLAMAEPAEWKRSWPTVGPMFFEIEGRLHNKKVDAKRPEILQSKEDRKRGARLTNEALKSKREAYAMRYAERDAERTLTLNAERTPPPSPSPSPSPSLPENTHTPEVRAHSTSQEIDPDEFEKITAEIWTEHPPDRRSTLQQCRQYASQAISQAVNGQRSIAAAGRNHKCWLLIYSAGGYSHSLKTWWTDGYWMQNPGDPKAKSAAADDPMAGARAFRAKRRELV